MTVENCKVLFCCFSLLLMAMIEITSTQKNMFFFLFDKNNNLKGVWWHFLFYSVYMIDSYEPPILMWKSTPTAKTDFLRYNKYVNTMAIRNSITAYKYNIKSWFRTLKFLMNSCMSFYRYLCKFEIWFMHFSQIHFD